MLAKLESAGLQPGAAAEAHTWLRRVTFDLTGLPPTEAEIAAFIAAPSPLAHERVVDRLLDSKAYGERWARHWLDLVGYAEQIGTEGKVFAEHAWRYRDYLLKSFSADKPFDRFIREQIAGDLLPATSPQERRENLIATGFIVLGDVDINSIDKLKMEYDFVDSQVSKVGTAFLGMTLGCVRCHDHKFDAIGQQDYYGIAGMFRSTKTTFRTNLGIWSNVYRVPLPEMPEDRAAASEHQKHLANWHQEKDKLTAELKPLEAALKDKAHTESPETKKHRAELTTQIKTLEGKIAHAEYFDPGKPQALAVADVAEPADMRLTIRGNPYALGDTMPRGLVRVAMWAPAAADPRRAKRPPAIGRLDRGRAPSAHRPRRGEPRVAEALRRGPRAQRGLLRHSWREPQPSGAARSPRAIALCKEGWSQKKLIRLARSRAGAYRTDFQRAVQMPAPPKADPENRLLWRMNRQRLDAESIRDAMLAASGRLAAPAGGPGLPLEFPENVSGLPLTPKSNHPQFAIKTERASQNYERTLYLPVVRTGTQPGSARLRDVFDFPQPAQITGKRNETTVPTQSLYLLNADLIRQRAADLAGDLLATTKDSDPLPHRPPLAACFEPSRHPGRASRRARLPQRLQPWHTCEARCVDRAGTRLVRHQ
ncbi:MAG: DUF1549 domain-containing protein [Burkholderiaceae bacterium]